MKWLQTYVCLNEELDDIDDKRRYYQNRQPRSAIEMEMLHGLELELRDRFSQLLKERMKLLEVLAEVNCGHRVPVFLAEG